MSDKTIEMMLDAASLKTVLPQDERLKITHLNIGYLISNYHVGKDAAQVRLLMGAGLIEPRWFRRMRPMIRLC